MSATEDTTINPDGSTNFEDPPGTQNAGTHGADEPPFMGGDTMNDTAEKLANQGIDPALYLLLAGLILGALYYYFVYRKKSDESDEFFTELDGDKFNFKLPTEVEEYYILKEKVEATGWTPGAGSGQKGGPHAGAAKVLAQALLKRAIADIPIITNIQKESSGMNKLYSQSMCSVNQWRAYQNAEAMVSAEVEDVRTEADLVEPGWSQVIFRQAMQYHNTLKQKHEAEAKAAEELAKKRRQVEQAVAAAKANDPAKKALEAERAAAELIKAEERELESKKAFTSKGGTMKKGFLENGGKGKKGKK